MIVPSNNEKLVPWALDVIDKCRVSAGQRGAMARSLRSWLYNGSSDGSSAIYNKLHSHVDRLASYLFSPSDLKFHLSFENHYPRSILQQAAMAGRVVTREYERRKIDLQFSAAVFSSLTYGCMPMKFMVTNGGIDARLINPWNFGVYREDKTELDEQEAFCESSLITLDELWRRISHLPNAVQMYRRAKHSAKKNTAGEGDDSYFHQVLIGGASPAVQTTAPFVTQPGGIVNVNADYNGAMLSPEISSELVLFHELTVVDDARGDYTTIQIAEPDILIAPRHRRQNFFVPEEHPYVIIRPNFMANYFWGRSELLDLLKPQSLLRDRLEDIKRIMSLQYDKLLAFIGFDSMNDEAYDQFRNAGWITNDKPGAKVEDLTPKLPDSAFTDVHEIERIMDEISGFSPIVAGQGEPGVRAGNHAQILMRNASPRLRDRALLVERQCADSGDKLLSLMAAKQAKAYWVTDKAAESEEFLLSQLPEDRRVEVDSHSSSPIYMSDHEKAVAFGVTHGFIDGESAIDLLSMPHPDLLKERYREMQQQKAEQLKMLAQHPELAAALKGKGRKVA